MMDIQDEMNKQVLPNSKLRVKSQMQMEKLEKVKF